MSKIEKLTPAQETDLAATYKHWLAVGRNTAPIDVAKASEAITAMYAEIGKPRPTFMVFSSPAMVGLAMAALKALAKSGSQLGSQLDSQLGSQLYSQLGSQLRSQLWSQLGSQLDSQLWSQLRSQLDSQLDSQLRSHFAGQHWCAWEVFYDFCNRIGVKYAPAERAGLDLWLTQSRECHWWWPFDGLCILSDRHTTLNVDDRGRLHSLAGSAVAYSDGWSIHAVHGVVVPAYVIEHPQEITPAKIDAERNAEVRRVMIERYGQARYLSDAGAVLVHQDQTGKLWRKELRDDEPLMMVEVIDSTPMPSGERKTYFLRVDPNAYGGLKTAHAAVASTWRDDKGAMLFKRPDQYCPAIET